jgi:hypothetical protein
MKGMEKLLNLTFNSSKPEFFKSELTKSQLVPLKLRFIIVLPAKPSKTIINPEISSKNNQWSNKANNCGKKTCINNKNHTIWYSDTK